MFVAVVVIYFDLSLDSLETKYISYASFVYVLGPGKLDIYNQIMLHYMLLEEEVGRRKNSM